MAIPFIRQFGGIEKFEESRFPSACGAGKKDHLPFHVSGTKQAFIATETTRRQHRRRCEKGDALAGIVRKLGAPLGALGDFVAQHRAEQPLFIAEIMVQHPLVAPGAAGDGVHPRAGKSFGGKFNQSGGQNAPAGAVGITTGVNHGFAILMHG